MLRIAICDDNLSFLTQIHALTQDILVRLDAYLKPMIDTYDDGNRLVEKIHDDSRYDIVLLDWDMPILGGEATGQALREFDKDLPDYFHNGLCGFCTRGISTDHFSLYSC